MSIAKYFSYITLGMSLSACSSYNPKVEEHSYVGPEFKYPGKVVAIRVCDGMHNCTEWRSPDGAPYSSVDIPQIAQPMSKLPPPRLISTGKASLSSQKVLPKVSIQPLEDIVIDEEPVCEGDSCRIPGK